MWSIEEAERMLGQPPNTPQVVAVFHHNYTRMVNNAYLNAFLQNLYRADKFYADKQMLCWSTQGPVGEERKDFEKYSDRFRRLYPGYLLDKN